MRLNTTCSGIKGSDPASSFTMFYRYTSFYPQILSSIKFPKAENKALLGWFPKQPSFAGLHNLPRYKASFQENNYDLE